MGKKPYEFTDLSLLEKVERELKNREEKEDTKIFKICLICKTRKSISHFGADKRSSDGRLGVCKVCRAIQSLKYYYENREEILVRTKRYNETHKQDRTIYFQGYQRDNREHLQKLAKVWYRKNKKKIKKRNLKYYEDNREHCQTIRKLWIKGHKEEIRRYNREYCKLKSKGGDVMLKRSKGGFTLIELMVVVVIIGVLAVMGLRFYNGQVEKAKNAVVKANVGTIQTLIQAELADRPVTDLEGSSELTTIIFIPSGIRNPVTGIAQPVCPASEELALAGEVWVTYADNTFQINGRDTTDTRNVFDISLEAIK